MKEQQPHIKKCENFRRAFLLQAPQRELAWCTVKGTDMRCGGFSDFCPIPNQFRADDGTPNELVLFDASEIDARIKAERE